jgi:hypothetical protein
VARLARLVLHPVPPPWLIVVFFVAFVAPAIWLCSQFIDAPYA